LTGVVKLGVEFRYILVPYSVSIINSLLMAPHTGALFNLGMKATVKADIQAIPTCHFTVVDVKGTAAATQGGGPGPMV